MDYPFQERLANALVSYANYLGQTCWPVNLAVYYPHPCGTITAVQLGGAVLLLAPCRDWPSGSCAQPYLAVGWAWFLGMLVPVIGLVQVGVQVRADRYTYLPHVGLFVAVAWVPMPCGTIALADCCVHGCRGGRGGRLRRP